MSWAAMVWTCRRHRSLTLCHTVPLTGTTTGARSLTAWLPHYFCFCPVWARDQPQLWASSFLEWANSQGSSLVLWPF